MIHGNTQGIRDSVLQEMEALYDADMELLRHTLVSQPLMEELARLTARINREISVYVARDGMVMDVSVGQHDRVNLPDLKVRRGHRRLTGIRCIHTHPDGSVQLSSVDERTLKRMRFDAMIALGVRGGQPLGVHVAMLSALLSTGDYEEQLYGPYRAHDIPHDYLLEEVLRHETEIGRAATVLANVAEEEERAILVGMNLDGRGEASLEELARLAETAGAKVLHQQLQNRSRVDAATYLGSGKVQELCLLRQSMEANLVIVDDELTGAQLRNLEEALGCKVIDRTTLILDIFAGRATTHEGKLQVELAQYKYRLPRLTGAGTALSRLGGGIGTRGPGESKLESDRRRIRRRIHELESEVATLKARRNVQREQRTRSQQPTVALVGYTNAGKSTLLNALAGLSDAYVEDQLFATLDPLTRKVRLPGGTVALVTDTVGFINKLPHDLIDAFRSTLEEAVYADLVLHVVDSASPEWLMQYEVAEGVLRTLGAGGKNKLIALNKSDLAPSQELLLAKADAPVVAISAKQGLGLEQLMAKVEELLTRKVQRVSFVVPYSEGALLSQLHDDCQVHAHEYLDEGVLVDVTLSNEHYDRIRSRVQPVD